MHDVEQALGTLHPSGVFEVRGIGMYEEIYSGYFTNPVEATKVVTKWANENTYKGLYVTLNQLHEGVLARKKPNTFGEAGRIPTASDNDVIRRNWILVDVDANRPAGISASGTEIANSRIVRDCLFEWAKEFWAGDIITAASGNGSHMLLQCAQQYTDNEVKAFLQQLPNMVDDSQAWGILQKGLVKIDRKVFNLGRITKLYGTITRKGWELPIQDRFYRKSIIEEVYRVKLPGSNGQARRSEPAHKANGYQQPRKNQFGELPGKEWSCLL